LGKVYELQKKRLERDRTLTQKWNKNEKVKALSIAREEEVQVHHELNEDRKLIHEMNM
jgi:hypothetical protein